MNNNRDIYTYTYTYVSFGQSFNQNINEVIFPKNLKSMTFGNDFNQSIDNLHNYNLSDVSFIKTKLDKFIFKLNVKSNKKSSYK